MVDAVANVLLESLRDLLVEEVKFLSGVSDEVTKVEADLRTIHGLLMEADSNGGRTHSPTLKNCIDELKELAFKAENVLETYAIRKEGKSLKKKLQRFMGLLCECYSLHQVGDEIDDIRSRLADITGRLGSVVGEAGSSNSAHQEQRRLLRLRYAHEVDQHFVGMEKDIHSVVLMVNDTEYASVISICGMGGLGKTTLARKIYNHRNVQGSFDGRAWVCVTQQFQADTILREIFGQIDGKNKQEVINMGLPELVRELHNALEQRKCIIVIDDIWENDHWNILKPAFPTKNCKVVLTTRNQNIASQECHLHKLDFLSEDEGWDLLAKIALPTINDDATQVLENRSKSFEDIGRQMVKKCGCLPLAISVIGGVLRQKQQILAEWEKVSSNLDSFLRHGGEGIGNDIRVKLVLDLSFDVLPYYLKPCFLYLSCFPEDEEINTERLYLLWLAEGLISLEEKGDNETLRDVAQRYLRNVLEKMLMSRSLISLEIRKGKIGCNFPSYKQGMCRNLRGLEIENCEIEGDVVEVLGKYPMLQILCLEGRLGEVEKKSEMRFGPNSFPELKFLCLFQVLNLRKWEVEKGAMIKLRELMIVKCRNLEKLPDGLRFISTLERVTCFGMSEELKDRMRRGENGEGGGQDYANFSHIPSLFVN